MKKIWAILQAVGKWFFTDEDLEERPYFIAGVKGIHKGKIENVFASGWSPEDAESNLDGSLMNYKGFQIITYLPVEERIN